MSDPHQSSEAINALLTNCLILLMAVGTAVLLLIETAILWRCGAFRHARRNRWMVGALVMGYLTVMPVNILLSFGLITWIVVRCL